jgi:hypothetical protein
MQFQWRTTSVGEMARTRNPATGDPPGGAAFVSVLPGLGIPAAADAPAGAEAADPAGARVTGGWLVGEVDAGDGEDAADWVMETGAAVVLRGITVVCGVVVDEAVAPAAANVPRPATPRPPVGFALL